MSGPLEGPTAQEDDMRTSLGTTQALRHSAKADMASWCVLGTSAIVENLGLAYTSDRQPKFERPEDT